MIKAAIITVSDKGSRGQREDLSGEAIKHILKKIKTQVIWYKIVPDEVELIKSSIIEAADQKKADLILTTGGTGFAARDITPEATKEVIEKLVPGISEIIRMENFKKTPQAALSRAIAGIRGKSLIVNLPGSPKGVKESIEVIIDILPHGISILKGEVSECGKE